MNRLVVPVVSAALALLGPAARAAPLPGGTQDPLLIPKYVEPLVVPPLMPSVGADTYSIAARPDLQQVLPTGFPATQVFAYGSTSRPASFSWPAFTIEARQGWPVTVTWKNQLVDASGNFVPHLLPVDPTLHWANPPGPVDSRPTFTATPGPYTGPVPIVSHLHGGHVDPQSDGYPEAWFLPSARDVSDCATSPGPGCFFARGSNYGNAPGFRAFPGQATFVYRNDQKAATLWYHDHTLGMTRANVYAGLAGFYLLRDRYEASLKLPGPYGRFEIPLAIQDRSFNADGSLFYPDSRVFFDGFAGPYIPNSGTLLDGTSGPSDISPIWNPEFFGNTMVVNGKTWPKLTVEARRYRFRVLNGCDSRWLVLAFAPATPTAAPLQFTLIGTEGGFVSGPPARLTELRLGPGERADVVVDFSAVAPGARVLLTNVGPDEPFGGVVDPAVAADPDTTGQVMAFDVVRRRGHDSSVVPAAFAPPRDGFEPKAIPDRRRNVTITEFDSVIDPDGPSEAQLGDASGPKPWMDPITENIQLGSTEEWTIVNRTADAHPIHIHQTQFRVVNRAPLHLAGYDAAIADCQATPPVGTCPPDPYAFVNPADLAAPFAWESGPKDTLQTNPGEITVLRGKFDIPGLYVWHCHILSHEDNEMMRPLCVSPDPLSPICQP